MPTDGMLPDIGSTGEMCEQRAVIRRGDHHQLVDVARISAALSRQARAPGHPCCTPQGICAAGIVRTQPAQLVRAGVGPSRPARDRWDTRKLAPAAPSHGRPQRRRGSLRSRIEAVDHHHQPRPKLGIWIEMQSIVHDILGPHFGPQPLFDRSHGRDAGQFKGACTATRYS